MVTSRKQRRIELESEPIAAELISDGIEDGGGVVGEMGARLRAARKARGLSTGQLAAAAGVTRGFLSQLERGMTSASIATTVRICTALGIRVGELFEPAHADVVRKDLRPLVEYKELGAIEYLITPPANSRIEAYDLTIEPGGHSDDPRSVQALAGFIYVLDGQVEFHLGETAYRITAGDSLSYSPSEPLSWRNASQSESARLLWVLTG